MESTDLPVEVISEKRRFRVPKSLIRDCIQRFQAQQAYTVPMESLERTLGTGVIKQDQAKNVRSHGRLELGFSSQEEGSRLLTQQRRGFEFL
jgi:hypothetical protein